MWIQEELATLSEMTKEHHVKEKQPGNDCGCMQTHRARDGRLHRLAANSQEDVLGFERPCPP